jgi:hypothetical protein
LYGRVVFGEIQRDGGRSAGAQVELAEKDHHHEDDCQFLKGLEGFRPDCDGLKHFCDPHRYSAQAMPLDDPENGTPFDTPFS